MNDKRVIHSWCMYDWANSAFSTTIMAAVLPIFFRNVAAVSISSSQSHMATSIWGYTTAFAMLIVACLALVLGPVSDFSASKKRYMAVFVAIGVTATALLTFTGKGDWITVCALFIIGCIGSVGSEVFYDSLLPHIASPGEMDRVSTKGYALGYLGGAILLAVNLAFILYLPKTVIQTGHDPVPALGMKLSFFSVAIWWAFFSIPLFRDVPEPGLGHHLRSGEHAVGVAVRRLSKTFHEIRKYKQAFLFIVAFWLYNDGIATILKMGLLFGDEIGISTLDLIGALMLNQVLGIPFTMGFGKMAKKIGSKNAILLGILVYVFITLGAFLMTRAIHFWILAFMSGMVQGGTQALSRSVYARLIPRNKSAEFFSFYNISGRLAGVLGPVVFAATTQIFANSRLGVLSLTVFFVAGGLVLMKVKTEDKE